MPVMASDQIWKARLHDAYTRLRAEALAKAAVANPHRRALAIMARVLATLHREIEDDPRAFEDLVAAGANKTHA